MTDFHFIRPLWLLAIFLLIAALYLLKRLRVSHSGWDKILPNHLAQVLITTEAQTALSHNNKKNQSKPLSLLPPAIIGLLTIIALAGPTWQKLPQPVFKANQGSVLIMDMSYSMYATDITPNRLTRARYKAIDLLNDLTEGDVGLIAYAGDAFIISPLTEDTNNIKLLLPSLSPDLMPEPGSNPLAAFIMADKMLKNSGHIKGDIYWFTDGVDKTDVSDIEQWLKKHPYKLHILGVGTPNGAPIKLPNGELLKDNSGAIVIPRLNMGYLSGLAKQGRGNYQTISNDSHDIDSLIADSLLKNQSLGNQTIKQSQTSQSEQLQSEQFGDQWQEAGPYLLPIILLLLLGYFRRGTIVMLLPFVLLLAPQQQAQANLWQDLWKTSDQQAQQKFDQKAYKQAAKQFKNPLWQGSAYYKAGDYEKALKSFKKSDSAQALYNQGNALAKLKKIDQAIDAYKKALAKDPNLSDAEKNKKILEQLKKQQQKNKQKQKNEKNQSDKNKQQNKNKQKSEQQKSEQQKSQQQKSQQQKSEQQKSEQQKSEQQKSEQQKSEQQKSQQQKAEQQKAEQQKAKQQKAEQAKKQADKKLTPKQKTAKAKAKLAKQQHDKEMQQKYQQLLNKVTDDPYLLLRNKMQLEYQKRRGNTQSRGSDKKW
jgi:Ca-activated chloride channel family protein